MTQLNLALPPRNSSVDFRQHGYEVVSFIGKGQFGTTYRVRRLYDSSEWLAKQIELISLDERDKSLSLQEAELMKGLVHPSIVRCIESFIHNNMYLVIVMEYCERGDLNMLLADVKKTPGRLLDEDQILRWFVQLICGLHHIHSEKIIHRDLKPSNILLDTDGNVKIGDFGISRVMSATLALAETAVGTPQYMSPEMCENKPYTYKSDVWALGCIIYELCAQKNAFQGESFLALVWNIAFMPIEPIPRNYSPQLHNLIEAMLTKSPQRRPLPIQILNDSFIQAFLQRHVSPDKNFVKKEFLPIVANDTGTNTSAIVHGSNSQDSNDRLLPFAVVTDEYADIIAGRIAVCLRASSSAALVLLKDSMPLERSTISAKRNIRHMVSAHDRRSSRALGQANREVQQLPPHLRQPHCTWNLTPKNDSVESPREAWVAAAMAMMNTNEEKTTHSELPVTGFVSLSDLMSECYSLEKIVEGSEDTDHSDAFLEEEDILQRNFDSHWLQNFVGRIGANISEAEVSFFLQQKQKQNRSRTLTINGFLEELKKPHLIFEECMQWVYEVLQSAILTSDPHPDASEEIYVKKKSPGNCLGVRMPLAVVRAGNCSLASAFAKFDPKSDCLISRQHFRTVMHVCFPTLSSFSLNKCYQVTDKNRQGMVKYRVWLRRMEALIHNKRHGYVGHSIRFNSVRQPITSVNKCHDSTEENGVNLTGRRATHDSSIVMLHGEGTSCFGKELTPAESSSKGHVVSPQTGDTNQRRDKSSSLVNDTNTSSANPLWLHLQEHCDRRQKRFAELRIGSTMIGCDLCNTGTDYPKLAGRNYRTDTDDNEQAARKCDKFDEMRDLRIPLRKKDPTAETKGTESTCHCASQRCQRFRTLKHPKQKICEASGQSGDVFNCGWISLPSTGQSALRRSSLPSDDLRAELYVKTKMKPFILSRSVLLDVSNATNYKTQSLPSSSTRVVGVSTAQLLPMVPSARNPKRTSAPPVNATGTVSPVHLTKASPCANLRRHHSVEFPDSKVNNAGTRYPSSASCQRETPSELSTAPITPAFQNEVVTRDSKRSNVCVSDGYQEATGRRCKVDDTCVVSPNDPFRKGDCSRRSRSMSDLDEWQERDAEYEVCGRTASSDVVSSPFAIDVPDLEFSRVADQREQPSKASYNALSDVGSPSPKQYWVAYYESDKGEKYFPNRKHQEETEYNNFKSPHFESIRSVKAKGSRKQNEYQVTHHKTNTAQRTVSSVDGAAIALRKRHSLRTEGRQPEDGICLCAVDVRRSCRTSVSGSCAAISSLQAVQRVMHHLQAERMAACRAVVTGVEEDELYFRDCGAATKASLGSTLKVFNTIQPPPESPDDTEYQIVHKEAVVALSGVYRCCKEFVGYLQQSVTSLLRCKHPQISEQHQLDNRFEQGRRSPRPYPGDVDSIESVTLHLSKSCTHRAQSQRKGGKSLPNLASFQKLNSIRHGSYDGGVLTRRTYDAIGQAYTSVLSRLQIFCARLIRVMESFSHEAEAYRHITLLKEQISRECAFVACMTESDKLHEHWEVASEFMQLIGARKHQSEFIQAERLEGIPALKRLSDMGSALCQGSPIQIVKWMGSAKAAAAALDILLLDSLQEISDDIDDINRRRKVAGVEYGRMDTCRQSRRVTRSMSEYHNDSLKLLSMKNSEPPRWKLHERSKEQPINDTLKSLLKESYEFRQQNSETEPGCSKNLSDSFKTYSSCRRSRPVQFGLHTPSLTLRHTVKLKGDHRCPNEVTTSHSLTPNGHKFHQQTTVARITPTFTKKLPAAPRIYRRIPVMQPAVTQDICRKPSITSLHHFSDIPTCESSPNSSELYTTQVENVSPRNNRNHLSPNSSEIYRFQVENVSPLDNRTHLSMKSDPAGVRSNSSNTLRGAEDSITSTPHAKFGQYPDCGTHPSYHLPEDDGACSDQYSVRHRLRNMEEKQYARPVDPKKYNDIICSPKRRLGSPDPQESPMLIEHVPIPLLPSQVVSGAASNSRDASVCYSSCYVPTRARRRTFSEGMSFIDSPHYDNRIGIETLARERNNTSNSGRERCSVQPMVYVRPNKNFRTPTYEQKVHVSASAPASKNAMDRSYSELGSSPDCGSSQGSSFSFTRLARAATTRKLGVTLQFT